jgi:hypothetical protein
MLGSDFRGLAESVTRTYGDDPWFFLRELAQNSRDAGARRIEVTTETPTPGTETLTFADDGRGMTLEHARRFLFRLFASDKGSDTAAAGRFGIGFWTILRFQPTAIVLRSRRRRDAWAVALDAGLQARLEPCPAGRPGTTVILTRAAVYSSAEEFSRAVESGLLTYCRYLRRNDRGATMLPICFAGRNLTEPMVLPGPLSMAFRSGPLEGAVGLGEKPDVRIFARGLPVWRGGALGQMSHLQIDADIRTEVGAGLAPVFLLNGNHLDVTFARNLAVENRELERVRRKAASALRRLLKTSLAATFPGTFRQRVHDRLQDAWAVLRRPGWHWLLPVLPLLIALEIMFLRPWFSAAGGAPSWFDLRGAPASYRGAVVDGFRDSPPPPFSYSPPGRQLFRLFVADVYDERSGFVRRPSGERHPLPPVPRCAPDSVMSQSLRARGKDIFLPLAPGHELLPGTLRFAGRPLASPRATVQGETIVALPAAGGRVDYRSCPGRGQRELTASERERFLALPAAVVLPEELETAARAARPAAVAERVALALLLTGKKLEYDISPFAAARFRESDGEASWLTRVLRIGRGDCDVLNGVQVLLLRKMGVPARLVIGMVGAAGRASPRLHAWGEYFDHGWTVSDATPVRAGASPPTARVSPPSASASPAPEDPPPGPGRSILLPGLLVLLAASTGLAAFLQLRRWPSGGALAADTRIRTQLLQVARQALLQPELWGNATLIQRHRLLPTVGGGDISLLQAQRLLRQNRLFVTANRNPLALAMAESRMTVLDLSQPLYAPWLALLPGAVDCDLLCRLRPEPPLACANLLATVNVSLQRRWRPLPALVAAPGLRGREWLRVSLPRPLGNSPFYFPRRFIAVAAGGKLISRANEMYAENPSLAAFRFLRRLHEDGALEDCSARRFIKTARRLLRGAHG